MKQQNKAKEKLTTKKLTKIFSIIWFGLVFVFTFCLISPEIKAHMDILAGSVFGTLGLSIIVWLIMFLVIRKKSKTENDKKIEQALKQAKKEEEKEQNK